MRGGLVPEDRSVTREAHQQRDPQSADNACRELRRLIDRTGERDLADRVPPIVTTTLLGP